MKNRIKTLLLSSTGLLLLGGCYSGVLDSDTEKVAEPDLGCRFVIDSIAYDGNDVIDWHDEYFTKIDGKKLASVSSERYQTIFSSVKTVGTIPVFISIKQQPEVLNYWQDLPLVIIGQPLTICSLGIIPSYVPRIRYGFDVDIMFQNQWGREIFTTKETFSTKEGFWMSSLPYVWCFYAGNGKLKYSGSVTDDDLKQKKANLLAQSISDSVARSILSNRKQIKQKILLSEVEKRWGVLIGLESDRALFSADDAREWRSWMENNGWNRERIKLLIEKNVLKNNIEGVVENFLGTATANDMIVVMWSGDVYADPARPDDIYLTCKDTAPAEPWTGYRLADLFKALKENRATKVVLMLDVCNDSGKKLLTPDYLKKLNPLADWLLLVSESSKRDHQFALGTLARSLPEGLDGKADTDGDQLVTLKELMAWLRSNHPDIMILPPAEQSKLPEYPLSNK